MSKELAIQVINAKIKEIRGDENYNAEYPSHECVEECDSQIELLKEIKTEIRKAYKKQESANE